MNLMPRVCKVKVRRREVRNGESEGWRRRTWFVQSFDSGKKAASLEERFVKFVGCTPFGLLCWMYGSER